MKDVLKFLVALAGVAAAAIAAARTDGVFTDVEKLQVGDVVVGAIAVYAATNLANTTLARYTKGLMMALSAALVAATGVITDGMSSADWWQVGLAALATTGVIGVAGPLWQAARKRVA